MERGGHVKALEQAADHLWIKLQMDTSQQMFLFIFPNLFHYRKLYAEVMDLGDFILSNVQKKHPDIGMVLCLF